MGHGSYSDASYKSYTKNVASTSRSDLFHRTSASAPVRSIAAGGGGQEVNVEKIKFRESRDSADHPCSMPILVGLDVTGSMGFIPEHLVKGGLGDLMGQLMERQPVADPHLLFLAIGDAVARDQQPLQATQFESDNKIVGQLTDLYLEGGGGGNDFESYDLAWAFAAWRTQTDAWEKRKALGYCFTIGDEQFPKSTSDTYVKRVFGNDSPSISTPDTLLKAAQERYRVFHIIVEEGDYARHRLETVRGSWREHLQKRALSISNHIYIPHLIVSAIAIDQGKDVGDVLEWWPKNIAGVLKKTFTAVEES